MPRILLIGATGFVGQSLGQELARQGYEINLLSRGVKPEKLAFPCQRFDWGGDDQALPAASLDGVDAVVNMAGESIAEGRWTPAKKARLHRSRIGPTAALAGAVASRDGGKASRPRVVIQFSASGYYGDTGEQLVDEHAASADDFLGRLCVDWEAAAAPLATMGVRLVYLRLGIVLGRSGGMLPKLAKLYHRGLGAAPGTGKQWLSWIHIDDLVQLVLTTLKDERASGPDQRRGADPMPF